MYCLEVISEKFKCLSALYWLLALWKDYYSLARWQLFGRGNELAARINRL